MDERDMVKRVRSFASSELKLNILLRLKYNEQNINDLQTALGGRNTTILHAIRDMSDEDLIYRGRYGYKLTNLGSIRTSVLEGVIAVLADLEARPDFWLNHDISSIPPEMLDRLSMLLRSEMISPDPTTPLECQERLAALLSTSSKIIALLPVMIFPKDSEVFLKAVRRGASVELLLTDNIAGTLMDDEGILGPEVRRALKFENFKLRHTPEEIRLALFVTESFLYLGLYRLDGVYDIGSETIYIGEGAVQWGMQLFEFYARRAEGLDEDGIAKLSSSEDLPGGPEALKGSAEGLTPLEELTIVLVEDNVGHAAFISRVFEERGNRRRLQHLTTLREALAWIGENRDDPFLVIADYLLPDGHGLDLTGNAASPLEVGFPLIILTGFGSEKIAVQALKSGAIDYVVKDAESMHRLPEIVEEALHKWAVYKGREGSKADGLNEAPLRGVEASTTGEDGPLKI